MRRALFLLPPFACVATLVPFSRPSEDPAPSPDRFFTDREGARTLELPSEDEGFFFTVYGDRTEGVPRESACWNARSRRPTCWDPTWS